jgi:transposase
MATVRGGPSWASVDQSQRPNAWGPPSKLTPELIETVASVLRRGAYVETAVAHVGISKTTYYEWTRKGADERRRIEGGGKARKTYGLFLNLLDAVEKAMADAELLDLRVISEAAVKDKSWQAGSVET